MYLGRAIIDANGQFAGIAQLGITIDYLEGNLSTVAVGGDGSVALISDDARMIARKLELLEEDVDVAELMRFCGKVVADAARTAGLALDVRRPAPDFVLRADPVRMRQILLNLLSNAVKFTPSGGRIVVSGARNGDQFVLSVADTGIGMAPDEAVKVLQPFYQVDNSITRRRQGTGLGLPLAKSLAELHGGRLDIETQLDAGTTVTIVVPINRGRASRAAATPAAAA